MTALDMAIANLQMWFAENDLPMPHKLTLHWDPNRGAFQAALQRRLEADAMSRLPLDEPTLMWSETIHGLRVDFRGPPL